MYLSALFIFPNNSFNNFTEFQLAAGHPKFKPKRLLSSIICLICQVFWTMDMTLLSYGTWQNQNPVSLLFPFVNMGKGLSKKLILRSIFRLVRY